MLEDDPRLFICTCNMNCATINPTCKCRMIPGKGWNADVHDRILNVQNQAYQYIQIEMQLLISNGNLNDAKIDQIL